MQYRRCMCSMIWCIIKRLELYCTFHSSAYHLERRKVWWARPQVICPYGNSATDQFVLWRWIRTRETIKCAKGGTCQNGDFPIDSYYNEIGASLRLCRDRKPRTQCSERLKTCDRRSATPSIWSGINVEANAKLWRVATQWNFAVLQKLVYVGTITLVHEGSVWRFLTLFFHHKHPVSIYRVARTFEYLKVEAVVALHTLKCEKSSWLLW